MSGLWVGRRLCSWDKEMVWEPTMPKGLYVRPGGIGLGFPWVLGIVCGCASVAGENVLSISVCGMPCICGTGEGVCVATGQESVAVGESFAEGVAGIGLVLAVL